MPIGVGIVGLGFGRLFAELYRLHPQAELVALSDASPSVRETQAVEFPETPVFATLEEVLACPAVEAVHIATPAPLHAEQSIQALRAGKHVLCAVPAALTGEDCRRLIAAQAETGLTYMMAETALYYPGTLCAEELLAAGEMGELVYAEADYVHGLGVPEDAGQVTWRWGYPPMWYITHSLGPIVRLSGQQVTEVVCFGGGRAPEGYANQYGNPFPLETALLRLSGGLTAKITIGFAGVAASGNELIRLYGTKMSLFAHEAPRCDVLIRGAQAECVELPDYRDRLPEPLRVGSILHGSLPFCVHEWISSLTQGRQPVVGVREAVAYTLPGLVAHQSALEGGRALAVPEV